MDKRHLWILLGSLMAVLVLGACRPAAVEDTATPLPIADPAEIPASPTATDSEPEPSAEEIAAQLPTPPSDAIIPTPASFRSEPAAVRGPADAAITIVEFSDYQCPYCLNYINDAYPQIIQNYVESGQVQYIFADFPLQQLHPQAIQAAEAARCAGEQDAYWEMHDQLFAAQNDWAGQPDPAPLFIELGEALDLDTEALQSCLESGRYRSVVLENLAEGQSLGVSGTPTFFINGYPIVGARPYDLFELAFAFAAAGRIGDVYAQAPTPTPLPLDQIPIANSPLPGSPDAPVLIIEYSDYQCPYCGRYIMETFSQIKKDYIDAGQGRYVFKDFPLSFHAQAGIAAQAARCAGDQGDYWGMHDLLFANQEAWANPAAPEVFRQYAQELGLDAIALVSCLESEVHAKAVESDLQEGASVGVTGVPAFFINGHLISGAQPYEAFQQAIEAALSEQ